MNLEVNKLLKISSKLLKDSGLVRAKHESILILKEILKKEYLDIMINSEQKISSKKVKSILGKVIQRGKGKPISKIFGQKEFYSLNFFTSSDTLDPRPETEILIDVVIKISKKLTIKDLDILDLGTGTGCIIINLFRELEKKFNMSAQAVDISKKALRIAERNLHKFKLNHKIQLYQSNWFDRVNSNFDFIVSNPPYIKTNKIPLLDREVLYDPILSLDGGIKGLSAYEKISEKASLHLKPNGYLVLEIGKNQLDMIDEIFKSRSFEMILKEKDLQGIDRVVVYQYKVRNT